MADRMRQAGNQLETEFATFVDPSGKVSKERVGARLLTLTPLRRVPWLSSLAKWMVGRSPNLAKPAIERAVGDLPTILSNRIAAVQLTHKVAGYHPDFRQLTQAGDNHRDRGEFSQAQTAYEQALRIFPLHGGYHVQLAHTLKEQGRDIEAFINYCFSLSLGVSRHDAEEHLLFAARRGGIGVSVQDVENLVSMWVVATKTGDNWDAPPIRADFMAFAELLWGNTGLVTPSLMRSYVLKCVNRKQLLLALIESAETIRHNRSFFIMLKERGLPRG